MEPTWQSDDIPQDPCRDCGACCFEQGSPPFSIEDPEDFMERLPKEAIDAIRERSLTWQSEPDAPCCWLNLHNMRCRFYVFRPQICRDFTPGSEGCQSWRDDYNIDIEKITG